MENVLSIALAMPSTASHAPTMRIADTPNRSARHADFVAALIPSSLPGFHRPDYTPRLSGVTRRAIDLAQGGSMRWRIGMSQAKQSGAHMAQTRTPHSAFGALALFAAAVAWPSFVGAGANLGMSPLERALRKSWCGVAASPRLRAAGSLPGLLGRCGRARRGGRDATARQQPARLA